MKCWKICKFGLGKERKTKNISSFEKWGFGEERKGEFRDSKSRKTGVKCGFSSIISHYVEV
jgi:hypothetical protein